MKVLIVTPHLSTGGLPQYLVTQIERLLPSTDVYLVEYSFAGPDFVVQRNRILKLLPERFWSLGADKRQLLSIIKQIAPDVIHWEEIPEMFCDTAITSQIYADPQRPFIVETTHTSGFDVNQKQFLPDKFVFVAEFSRRQYGHFGIPCDVVEYPVVHRQRPDRAAALAALQLDPEIRHVLNVGLFTPGKNQREVFDLAAGFAKGVQFHCVGNQAQNFQSYWEPLMKTQPPNCRVWGERSDVDAFYSACDLFLFTSNYELNPLVVKEALGWQMPVLMKDLPAYCGTYKEGPRIAFLTTDRRRNLQLILDRLE